MGLRIKRIVLTVAMLGLVMVALPAAARAETPRTSGGLTALQVKALSRNATQSVIVVFRNQLSALPAKSLRLNVRAGDLGLKTPGFAIGAREPFFSLCKLVAQTRHRRHCVEDGDARLFLLMFEFRQRRGCGGGFLV